MLGGGRARAGVGRRGPGDPRRAPSPSGRSARRAGTAWPTSSPTFRARHPEVRLRAVGQNSSEVADAVRDGEIEAGARRPARSTTAGSTSARPSATRSSTRAPTRSGPTRACRIQPPGRGAAHPLRRPLGRGGPDAPPARRARAAGRRRGSQPVIEVEDVDRRARPRRPRPRATRVDLRRDRHERPLPGRARARSPSPSRSTTRSPFVSRRGAPLSPGDAGWSSARGGARGTLASD